MHILSRRIVMPRRTLLSVLLSACAMSALQAQARLIAIGKISGQYQDLAHQSATPLENGIAGNQLGGLGSGLAYAGGTTFLALPDRGPNAKPYNPAVDDTSSYIPRFHTLDLALAPSAPGSALPFTLTPFLTSTTLLSSRTPLVYGSNGTPSLNTHRTHYFTGRSDAFDAARLSTDPNHGRLDPEGIRVSRSGRSIFISDEYGPYLYQFNRATGRRQRAFALPAKFAVSRLNAKGDDEIGTNTSGRVANKGMEALAITPDGHTLVGVLQSPLIQDGGTAGTTTRIVALDLRSGETREYAYPLTNIGSATKPKFTTVSEILAINDHEFLVDERDGKGLGDNSSAAFKRLYRIDLQGAAEVAELSGAAALAPKAVNKILFLDLVSALGAAGIRSQDIPAKLEGIAFGQDVMVDGQLKHTLFIANDNDFVATVTDAEHINGIENPNVFFVFAFGDADLPGLVPQRVGFDRDRCDEDQD
jgi:hypothetical protein